MPDTPGSSPRGRSRACAAGRRVHNPTISTPTAVSTCGAREKSGNRGAAGVDGTASRTTASAALLRPSRARTVLERRCRIGPASPAADAGGEPVTAVPADRSAPRSRTARTTRGPARCCRARARRGRPMEQPSGRDPSSSHAPASARWRAARAPCRRAIARAFRYPEPQVLAPLWRPLDQRSSPPRPPRARSVARAAARARSPGSRPHPVSTASAVVDSAARPLRASARVAGSSADWPSRLGGSRARSAPRSRPSGASAAVDDRLSSGRRRAPGSRRKARAARATPADAPRPSITHGSSVSCARASLAPRSCRAGGRAPPS